MENQINKKEYQKLVQEIVEEYYPNQKVVFDLFFEEEYSNLQKGKDIIKEKSNSGEFEFGESLVEVLQSIIILASTFKAILELIILIKKGKIAKMTLNDEISKKWKKELIEKGISPDEAEEITDNYKEKFKKLL